MRPATPPPSMFEQRPNLIKTFRMLFRYIQSEKKLFLEAVALTLLLTGLSLFIPKVISDAIDWVSRIHADKTTADLFILLGVTLGLYLVQCALSYREELCTSKFFLNIAFRMRKDYIEKITTATAGYINTCRHGDLISRGSNDIETVVKLLSETLFKVISCLVLFFGCLIVMLTVSWQLTLICLCSTVVTFLASGIFAHHIRKHASRQQTLLGGLNGFLEDCLNILKSVKLYNREEYLNDKFLKKSKELKKESVSTLRWISAVAPVNNLIGNLNFLCIAVIGGILAVSGESSVTVSIIVLFVLYVREYTEVLNDLTEIVSETQTATAATSRFFEVLDAPSEQSVSNSVSIENGAIELKNLHFSYIQGKEVLSDISLPIQAGQHIAIVGPSGCGKTTLIQLLLRLYEPDSGDIYISGVNIRQIPLPELRKNVVAIMQDDIVFDETLSYNISYGDAELNKAEIADLLDFSTDSVPVIDTLSRGQIQKICVMRAFSSDPKIIILDESMSLVDQITYNKLFTLLRKKFPTATFITITHQLSCLKDCDYIFYIADGKITEQGTFDHLVSQKGAFYQMLNKEN